MFDCSRVETDNIYGQDEVQTAKLKQMGAGARENQNFESKGHYETQGVSRTAACILRRNAEEGSVDRNAHDSFASGGLPYLDAKGVAAISHQHTPPDLLPPIPKMAKLRPPVK